MNYKELLEIHTESKHLISMVPVDGLIRLGCDLGFDDKTEVLDLCCGYGEMLKIWHETFGIIGTGVDRCSEFISIGTERLKTADIDKVTLIRQDVLKYQDDKKYDIVVCTEFFGGIGETISLIDKYLKPGGKLIFGRLFTKKPNPPKELEDFDGKLHTLYEIYKEIRESEFYLTAFTVSSEVQWERYIIWAAQRTIAKYRQNPDDEKAKNWIEKWYRIYFKYRRQYEGYALFGIERL